jgi:hypothetical protein
MANVSCARWGIAPLPVSPHPGVGLVRLAGERRWRREGPGGASPSPFPVRVVETLLLRPRLRPRLRLFTGVGILSCSRAGTYDRRMRQEAGSRDLTRQSLPGSWVKVAWWPGTSVSSPGRLRPTRWWRAGRRCRVSGVALRLRTAPMFMCAGGQGEDVMQSRRGHHWNSARPPRDRRL